MNNRYFGRRRAHTPVLARPPTKSFIIALCRRHDPPSSTRAGGFAAVLHSAGLTALYTDPSLPRKHPARKQASDGPTDRRRTQRERPKTHLRSSRLRSRATDHHPHACSTHHHHHHLPPGSSPRHAARPRLHAHREQDPARLCGGGCPAHLLLVEAQCQVAQPLRPARANNPQARRRPAVMSGSDSRRCLAAASTTLL